MLPKQAIIIGSGFSGLSAACFLAKAGHQVTVLEKQDSPGGRARQFTAEGFTFDMGPSWYWMPDVFDRFFASFGKKTSDYYSLLRLDPSYSVYWPGKQVNIPAQFEQLQALFESMEPGSSEQLSAYLEGAAYKYRVGMHNLVYKPGQSLSEFADRSLVKGLLKLEVFTSIKKHIGRYFRHPQLQQLLEFPILFLGALPAQIPALYSLMNYADMQLGTWYPQGGMYQVVNAMYQLALELGVKFEFSTPVTQLEVTESRITSVYTGKGTFSADVVIAGADYHFVENELLPPAYRSYTENYWDKRVMAPSCLIYFVGLNKKLQNLQHHSLFFDVPFHTHAQQIYSTPQWPSEPLFYVSCPSRTDATVAPAGGENLFILIPVAAGLEGDTENLREKYFQQVMQRLEQRTGESILDAVVYKRSYATTDFKNDYHAFKGNAYGLANTLKQTAILKPSLRSKKVNNLFYTGQLTVPGPGVPPSLISGEIAAIAAMKAMKDASAKSTLDHR